MMQNALQLGFDLCTSVVSVSEVFAGLRAGEQAGATALLRTLRWIPVTGEIAVLAGELRRHYSRQGITLALADMLIAATAISTEAYLATSNRKHFPMSEVSFYEVP